jgi:general stress protein CsbA
MSEILLALITPFLLIVITTRVTFSLIGASVVTWMVILSVMSVYDKPWWLLLLAIPSFLVGVWVAKKVLIKRPGM